MASTYPPTLFLAKATLAQMIAAISQSAVASACKLQYQRVRAERDSRKAEFVRISSNSFGAAKMGR